MTNQLPKISEAELEIMKVLWLKSPQTANEIIEELEDQWTGSRKQSAH